jgi:hydrogenase nickel incorporation protein HypA/HybF
VHELAISEAIVSEVCERVGACSVVRVVVEIGQLSAVVPDAVRFCFDLAARGTMLEGAALEILEIPGQARCRKCQAPVALGDCHLGTCPACGGVDLDVVGGQELRIKYVEVT